jgi:hypothetical protein
MIQAPVFSMFDKKKLVMQVTLGKFLLANFKKIP